MRLVPSWKEYRKNHPEQRKESQKKYRKNHPETQKRYRENHPEANKAHNLARYHCSLKSCCEFGSCGSTIDLQKAHMDYDYPLEVLTFCAKHHRLIDRLYRRFD